MCLLNPLGRAILMEQHHKVDSILTKIEHDSSYQDYLDASLVISSICGNTTSAENTLARGAKLGPEYEAIQSACMFGRADILALLLAESEGSSIPWNTVLPYYQVSLKFPDIFKYLMLLPFVQDFEDLIPDRFEELFTDEEKLFDEYVSTDELPFVQCIDMLLDQGAPINLLNEENQTALDASLDLINPNVQIITALMKNGFISNESTSRSDLLVLAARFNNYDFIKDQLDKNPDLINLRSSNGNLALNTALLYKNEVLADSLIKLGANIEGLDTLEQNAAHLAAKANSIAFFQKYREKLLTSGLSKDHLGHNALELSFIHSNKEIFNLISDGHLDTINIRSSTLHTIETEKAQDFETFSLTSDQIFMLNQLSHRKQLEINDESHISVLENYLNSNCAGIEDLPGLLNFFVREQFDFLTDLIFLHWNQCLTPNQSRIFLNKSSNKEAILMTIASDSALNTYSEDLLEEIVNIDTVINRQTAINEASRYGNWDLVRLLAQKGANPNIHAGRISVLGRSIFAGDEKTTLLLVNSGAFITPNETQQI